MVASLQPIREPRLLDVSTLVTEVGPWVEQEYTVGDYRWWSPHQILAFYGDKDERLIDIERKTVIPFPCPAVRDHDRPAARVHRRSGGHWPTARGWSTADSPAPSQPTVTHVKAATPTTINKTPASCSRVNRSRKKKYAATLATTAN